MIKDLKILKESIIISIILTSIISCNISFENDKFQETKVERNYGDVFEDLSDKFNIPEVYFKALAILECSGEKEIPERFEPNIYEQLKRVKSGEIDKFENITTELIKNESDKTLKEMSKSWGPFQLMGYKCIWLGVSIKDLKQNSTYLGAKWINLTYGDYIRKGKYMDAFHLHNAGKMYPDSGPPKTFDPKYVENGLKYLKEFQKSDSINKSETYSYKISVK